MDKWIRDLINSVTAGLTNLINAAVERILWVYNVVIGFFIKVRNAFDGALTGIRAKLGALVNLISEIYGTLWWIVNIRIPQIVYDAVNNAINYLLRLLNDVRNALADAINNTITWISQQVDRIHDIINRVIDWASREINAIIDTLTRVRDIVLALLTDPKRLATWAIDAIIGEFLRWVDRNADRLLVAIRERSVAYVLMAVDRIEDMIVRLL